MHAFFEAALALELQHNDRALELELELSRSFPKSIYVLIQARDPRKERTFLGM